MTLPQPGNSRSVPLWLVVALVLAAVIWFALRTYSPLLPRTLTISTGAPDGAYYQVSLKYQALLKENGVTLVLKDSEGSYDHGGADGAALCRIANAPGLETQKTACSTATV